jgi:hypothetical protein
MNVSPLNYHPLKEGYLLMLPVSSSEVQLFILDLQGQIIAADHIWKPHQQILCDSVIATTKATLLPGPHRPVLVPGSYHFGHFWGDLFFPLYKAYKLAQQNSELRLYIPNVPSLRQSYSQLFAIGFSQLEFIKLRPSLEPFLFLIKDALILFPHSDAILSLSVAHAFINRAPGSIGKNTLKQFSSYLPKIFLHSGRAERIRNLNDVLSLLSSKGFAAINCYDIDFCSLNTAISGATYMISENGSILMNCFMAAPAYKYIVLASPRCNDYCELYYEGGYKYNEFHKNLIMYHYGACLASSRHPYSDPVEYDLNALDVEIDLFLSGG